MSGGIVVDDDCIQEFTALRMKRSHRYLIMKVSEDKTRVVLEHLGERTTTFEEFKEKMPKDSCRYYPKSSVNLP